jgi:3-hydroxymyristoyl/3-hydroxydecanoyl-(acyl carrier protein) dehydratase
MIVSNPDAADQSTPAMTNAGSHRESLCVDPMHPSLAGHFPGHPVVPGVVLLDGVIECAQRVFGLDSGALRLPQVKFLQPLLPQQTAEIVLDPVAPDPATTEAAGMRIRFRIERDGAVLASGELIATPAITAYAA